MNNVRKASIAFSSLLSLIACFVATPASADGDCLAWNVTGPWTITQSNGTTVRMNLQQTDTHLQGVGEYSYYDNDDSKVRTIGGPVDGYLEHGTLVRVTAYWSNRTAGEYVGDVQADGGLNGYTVDKNDPGNKATFRASGVPQCVTRAAPPPKPTLGFGRVQAPAGTPPPPPMTMCEHAAAARARNSPAAPALAKRCAEEGGPPPSVGFGRVRVPPPPPAPSVPALPTPAPPMAPAPVNPAQFDPAQLDALAATGADIAGIDPAVDEARHAEAGAFYQLGFDIATGLFGDPILGAAGKAKMDASSESIRDSLSASGQRGFDASMKFHLVRH